MSAPKEVMIDGVRYVPAVDIEAPSVDRLRDALLGLFYVTNADGTVETYGKPIDEAASDVFVAVYDSFEGFGELPTVGEFITDLRAKLVEEAK